MVYRDDEDRLLYVTKRVVVQRGDIVCYRCVYLHDVIGQMVLQSSSLVNL